MSSRLLDIREAAAAPWRSVYDDMLALALRQQPAWFRPWLLRSRRLRVMTGYDHWSRAWEYPWAVLAASLGTGSLRVLDVGGGGSPFAPWLAAQGHEAHVVDPSLDQGRFFAWDPARGAWRNARTLAKQTAFRLAGIRTLWGLPRNGAGDGGIGRTGEAASARLRYWPYAAHRLDFPAASFDRVFCLSVIEHIPRATWPACMSEFARVLKPGGRLVMTMDMETDEANARLYRRLVESCPLRLQGDPEYAVPLDPAEAQRRHPGNRYETLGLVWTR